MFHILFCLEIQKNMNVNLVALEIPHLPSLQSGERIRCSYLDVEKLLVVGEIYTVKCNPTALIKKNQNHIDHITLMEFPEKTFMETYFDRITPIK